MSEAQAAIEAITGPGAHTAAELANGSHLPTPQGTAFPPPAPPAPPMASPRRRASPPAARVAAAVPPPARPSRQPLASAFGQGAETVRVWRVEDGRPTVLIGREYPREYLDAVGMDVHSFVLRNVVPEHGGGDYLVQGMDARGIVGEQQVKIAGMPKLAPVASPASGSDPTALFDAFGRAVHLGRDGVAGLLKKPDGSPKTIADALAEVQGLRALEKMIGADDPLAKRLDALTARIEQIAAVAAAPPAAPPAPPPPPDPIEQMLKLKTLMKDDKPAIDPNTAAVTALVEKLSSRLDQMEKERAQDRMATLEKQNKELLDRLTQMQQTGGISGFKQQYNELQDVAQIIAPQSGGGFAEVLATMAQSWTPDAIASMVERTSVAQLRAKMAARGALRPAPKAKPKPVPPLAAFVAPELKQKLLEASDAAEVLVSVAPIVKRLNEHEKLRPALEQMFAALADKSDRGDEAFAKNVQMLIELIYGAGHDELVENVVTSMLDNRDVVLDEIEKATGVKVKAPAAPAPAQKPSEVKAAPPPPPVAIEDQVEEEEEPDDGEEAAD